MKPGLLVSAMCAVVPCAVAHAQPAPAPTPSPAPSGPIIPDQQFESELPRVEGDLNAPLQPLSSFAAPAPAPAPAPSPATTPTPAPVPAPTAQPVPIPPDPALQEPLPPLATFDVTTPPAQPAEEKAAEKAATVRYRTVVEGLDQVGLEGRFRGLSALDKGDGEAANIAVVSARAKEDEQLALRILHSEGYYDAVATSSVAPVPNQPGRVTATITAAPGSRYNFGKIEVTGPPTIPPGIARDALKLDPGDPIIAADVVGAEANVKLKLPQQGYPFATIGERDILLDPATHLGDYTLPVDPGPRASFGTFTTTGKLAFDAQHVGVLARFKPGELYDSRKVDDLREAMVATGLFSSVAVEPVRTNEPGPDGTEQVNLNVIQQAGPPRTIAGQAGYATGEGFKLQASWTHRNLFPPEGALILSAVAGTQEQSGAVTFRRSNAGQRDRTVTATLNAGRQDYPAFKATSASLIGRISRDSTPIWQKVWTYNYGFELVASDETGHDPTRRVDDGTYFIAALNGQLGYDRSNSLLDPTKGFRITGRISPELSQKAHGDFDQYVRAQVDGSIYYPAADSFTLAARVRLGTIVGAPRDEIAPSRRLYSGGGGSVRGYGYQEIGPRDAAGNPVGGRSLNEFSVEGRYRFGNYGIVGFLDGGQIYESSTPKFRDLQYGVGIGGRLYTSFGPVRVDVATPLNPRKGDAKVTVYVSIGQAF